MTTIFIPIKNFENIINNIKNEFLNKDEFFKNKKELITEVKNDLINLIKNI